MRDVSHIIDRLTKVKSTGRDRWIACCPAHEDRSPSMTIAIGRNGGVLLHCFGGCDVGAIVSAMGMELSDLFPDAPKAHATRGGRAWMPAEVLRAVGFEALLVATCAMRMGQGNPMGETDRKRLIEAAKKITVAVEESGYAG